MHKRITMENEQTEIGFDATENWSVEDFYNFFHQINILYNRLYVLQEMKDSGKKKKLKYALYGSLSRVKSEDQLIVKSIEIHSPGDFNLLGVDKVIQQLRETLKDVLFRNRQERESSDEDLRHKKAMNSLKEKAGMQKILNNQITLMKQLNYDQEQIEIGIKALGDPIAQIGQISSDRKVALKAPNKEN